MHSIFPGHEVCVRPFAALRQAKNPHETGEIDLTESFDKAAGVTDGKNEGEGRGESGKGRSPKSKNQIRRYARKKNRDRDRGR